MLEPIEDILVECPYDKCHWILKSRLQTHLVKCGNEHTADNMQVCPFNATHRMKAPLYQHHVSICKDRSIVEIPKYNVGREEEPHGHLPVAAYTAPLLPEDTENWDNDDTPTYDPSRNTEGKQVIRSLRMVEMGAQQSKAKKKAFRRGERLRISNLQEGILPPPEPMAVPPSKPVPKQLDINTPLRQPRHSTLVGIGRGTARAAEAGMSPINSRAGLSRLFSDANNICLAASFQQVAVGRGTQMKGLKPSALVQGAAGRGVSLPAPRLE